jgi:hypothetical protein
LERDTNGDGWFDKADGLQRFDSKNAGRTMYIHTGGKSDGKQVNTWSAGCQTLPGNIYSDFLATIGRQASVSYVLINARCSAMHHPTLPADCWSPP